MSQSRSIVRLDFTAPPKCRERIGRLLEETTGGGTCLPAMGVWVNPNSGDTIEEPMDYWVTTSSQPSFIHMAIEDVQSLLTECGEISSWHSVSVAQGGISILTR